MPQVRFTFPSASSQRIEELDNKLREVYQDIKEQFRNIATFQEVLTNSGNYQSRDLVGRQEPEEFAKRKLIEPLIRFFGYEVVADTPINAMSGVTRTPDYTISPQGCTEPTFLVEAEPLNVDLRGVGHGVSQVEFWLSLRSSGTNPPYGIATNGLEWILLKYDTVSNRSIEVFQVNLKPIFISFLQRSLDTEDTLLEIKRKFLTFDSACA